MFLQGEFISEVDFVRYESMLKGIAYVLTMTDYCECYSDFDELDECFKLHCTFYDEFNNNLEWFYYTVFTYLPTRLVGLYLC